MSLISFTEITDGSTSAASQVNAPLTTIYNDYNGGITNDNISASAAIAGTKIAPGALRVRAGQYTGVNANGTFKISGLGFTPKVVLFQVGASQGSSGTHGFSLGQGYYDSVSATQGFVGGAVLYGTSAGGYSGGTPSTSFCIIAVNTAGTTQYTAAVSATDSDSFTLTVTNYAGAQNFFWIAYG